jgi:type I restriction enzyme, S subunit
MSVVPDDLPRANLTQGTARIRVSKTYSTSFVKQTLQSAETQKIVDAVSKGSTFQEISLEQLRKLGIPIPPLEEQVKIAEVLTAWDDALETLGKLIAAKLEVKLEVKRGLMRALLTGKKRFQEFEAREWKTKQLSEVSSFLDNKRIPLKDSDRQNHQEIYPYYGASGIIDYIDDFVFDDTLILFGEDGENILSRNLRLAFKVTGKFWLNNHAHVTKPNQK